MGKKQKEYIDQLADAAEELNDVLGLEPAIVTEGTTISALEKGLKDAAALINPSEDEISEETTAVLAMLRGDSEDDEDDAPADEEEEEGDDSEEEEEEEEEDDDEADEEEEDTSANAEVDPNAELIAQVKGAKQRRDLKILARTNFKFKAIKHKLNLYGTVEELQAAMLKLLAPAATAPATAKASKPAKPAATAPAAKAAKEAKPAKPAKPAKTPPAKSEPGKPSVTSQAVEFLTPLLKEGKHTQVALVELAVAQTGIKPSTASTLLTDGRNPKYNKFPKVVVKSAEGILSFAKG